MASFKEDERLKKDEKAQESEVPLLDIGTQAVIGIERAYQSEVGNDPSGLGGVKVELGNLPSFLTGKPLYYIPIKLGD